MLKKCIPSLLDLPKKKHCKNIIWKCPSIQHHQCGKSETAYALKKHFWNIIFYVASMVVVIILHKNSCINVAAIAINGDFIRK